MRVGLLIYGDLGSVSGGYLYDRALVDYLRGQGDTVEVISLPRPPYPLALAGRGVDKRLQNTDLDILIQDEMAHPSLYRFNRRQCPWPVVGLVHLLSTAAGGPGPVDRFRRHIESAYLATLDGLILNSRHSLEQAGRLLHGRLPPHVVAVPAADHFSGSWEPAGQPAATAVPLRLLFVGNLIRQKGLHVLLDSLAALPPGDFRLTVAGRPDLEPGYAAGIRRRVRGQELQGRVELLGPVPHGELPGLYRSHDLFVMPSVNEAYGIAYLEAQQFGLPAIGTTTGGAGELIEHGVNGYLIEPGDSPGLAAVLRQLHQDREHLDELGHQARAAYASHPGWAETGAKVRRFLLELTGPGEATP